MLLIVLVALALGLPVSPARAQWGFRPFSSRDSTAFLAAARADSLRDRGAAVDTVRRDTVRAVPTSVPPFKSTASPSGSKSTSPPPRAASGPAAGGYLSWTPWVSAFSLPGYFLDNRLFALDYPTGALQFPLDARTLQVRVDAQKGSISTGLSAADVDLGPERTESFDEYARRLTSTNLRRQWISTSRQRINQQPADNTPTRTGFSIALPFELPKAAQSLLGAGAPALNVSGSERISIAGRSNWTNQQSAFGRKPSLFPQLDMRQDLDINVTGTLGDRVSVDVAQFSGVQTPLSNRIALKFSGDDDQIIKKLDLGNTNLSLPNTQYVSYSGRNDGLFGVMGQAKLGSTDLTMIASKQEARSERTQFTGSTQVRTVSIEDWQYIQRTYFLLQLPDSMVDASGNPRPDAPSLDDLSSVEVFVDDRIDQDLGGEKPGYAELTEPRPGAPPDTVTRIFGKFDRKIPVQDFIVRRDLFGEKFPVLVLASAVPSSATLAVSYRDSRGQVGVTDSDTLRLKLLKPPLEVILASDSSSSDRFSDDPRLSPFAPAREYELRNFYSLGARDIDPKTAKLQVRQLVGGGSRTYQEQFTDPTTSENITYMEVTGLDLLNQSQGGLPVPGHDGSVDYFSDQSFVNWRDGIIYFPDLRPFAPRLNRPGDQFFFRNRITTYTLANRRRVLSVATGTPDDIRGNDAPYVLRNETERQNAKRFYIYGEFSSSSGSNVIYLRNTPIIEGSEIVTVNGETLVRERDYRINYQTGVVELLSAKAREGGAQLSIDYSYAPLFAQASKTLLGSAMKILDTDNYSLGSAFIYEARGLQEKRPRLGEEPSRTLIGDLNGRVDLRPNFLTSAVNLLPFYESEQDSRLQVSAEAGYSVPNPNTKNEVYLDDFEGARNSNGASMDARSWTLASPPTLVEGGALTTVNDLRSNAELKWFNPFNVVKQKDLRPNLTRAEDSQASVTVLSWWVPQPFDGGAHDSIWVGLMQSLDADGTDLSRSQFIDFWLNDFRDFGLLRKPGVKLHIDLGVMSEDEQQRPDSLPNGKLDTEDLPPPDRQLVPEEDVGLDGVADAAEFVIADSTARMNASGSDPEGDDWRAPSTDKDVEPYPERDPRRWRFNNGTEINQNYRPIPDTEDLDGDGTLDLENSFFRYTIDLSDTNYLDTDVYEKYANDPAIPTENRPTPDNGWRRFILPLDDPKREVIGNADLHRVKHVRVWLEGVTAADLRDPARRPAALLDAGVVLHPTLEMAELEVVGNRWVGNPIDSVAKFYGTNLTIRTVSNREDEAVYVPPIKLSSQTQAGSSAEEREQSLALRSENLVPGGRVSAYRPTTLSEDYSRYKSIRFFAAALDFSPQDSVRFFIRFLSDAGNDERNFYEYSAPVPPAIPLGTKPNPFPWVNYDLVLTDFSNLKINLPQDSLSAVLERPGPTGGIERLKVSGRPSFTRIQRVVIGLENAHAAPDSASRDSVYALDRTQPGELWVDELRSFDVARDRGTAQRVTMVSNLADLLSLNVGIDRQDEDFQRLGQARGTGNNYLSTQISGSLGLDKFVRGMGFNLPITFSFSNSRTLPRFRTGQDILLLGEDAQREKSTTWSRNWSTSFSHSGAKQWWLKNTLDAMSFRFAMSDDNHLSPTSTDTSRGLSGGGAYTLSPKDWLSLPIPLLHSRTGKAPRFYFLPQTLSLGFDMNTRRTIQYDRRLDGTLVSRLGRIYSKDARYNLSGAWKPIEILGYSFSSARNANLPGVDPMRIAGINFGRQTNFRQRFDLRLPIRLTQWLQPDLDGSTSFEEQRGPELSPQLVLGNFSNSANANLRWVIPLTRLTSHATPLPGAKPDTTKAGGGFGLPIGKVLSRLGDIQTRASFSRNTAYSRLTGYPSISYRLGLDREPGFLGQNGGGASVFRDPQSSDNSQRNLMGEASTQLQLWGRANARIRGSYNQNLRTSNNQAYQTSNLAWPDVTADWGPVQKWLGLGRIFPTLSAQTRYSRTVNEEGIYQRPINARTVSSNWQPLLSFTGTTKSGVQSLLAVEYISSLRQDYRNGLLSGSGASADTRQTNATGRFELSKTVQPGSKFKFFGLFGSTIRSTLTLALRGNYNRRTGGTTVPGQSRQAGQIRNDRVDLSLSGTYSFSRNVNGTLGLGFDQYRDFTRAFRDQDGHDVDHTAQRSLRVEANAQMSF